MSILFAILALSFFFCLAYAQAPLRETIVGVWKHQKDDVSFVFFNDGTMCFRIPFIKGISEIMGKYEMIDEKYLKIELDHQYTFESGKPILTKPQILKLTIHENKILFHDLKINELEEQIFIRVK
jgi:hypothetical protein